MESVNCNGHGKPCMLKTGVKDGPNYGRSFYICGIQGDRCDHVTEASGITIRACPMHPDSKIELQTLYMSQATQETKQMYRCNLARSEKRNWCGMWLVEKKKSAEPLKSRDGNVQDNTNVTSNQPSKPHSVSSSGGQKQPLCDPSPGTQKAKSSPTEVKVTEGQVSSTSAIPPEQKSLPLKHDKRRSAEKNQVAQMTSKPSAITKVNDQGDSHNLTFESLASKHKHRLKDMESDIKNTTLNDSVSYRDRRVMDANSDSDDDGSQDDGSHDDSGEAAPSGAGGGYRDNSVVDISSDEDEDDEDRDQATVRSGSPDSESSDRDQFRRTSPQSSATTEEKSGSLLSGANSKSGTQVIHTQRPDGTKVIKIVSLANKHQATNQARATAHVTSVTNQKSEGAAAKQSSVEGSNGDSKPVDKATDPVAVSNDLLKHVRRKNDLLKILGHQQDISKKVNMSALPDKGARIKQQIEQVTREISQLDLQINKEKDIIISHEQARRTGAKPKVVANLSTQQRTNASGQVLPSNMKQTLITNHAMTTELPSHVYQQMYSANPQMNTLYGGRMTAARLREVGSVTSEAIERLHKQLETMPSAETEAEDPTGIVVPLMQHQRQALKWLRWREEQHPPGGILADDMGLGKTLTMISHVVQQRELQANDRKQEKDDGWIKKAGRGLKKSKATLIVCPASLVHQWDLEIKRRCEEGLLRVVLYHGPNREKDLNKLVRADIVLTTYNLISREVGVPEDMKKNRTKQDMAVEDQEPTEDTPLPGLLSIAWERIILDEAHSIKNHKSLTAMSTCRLRALYRWALTGTPIQNDLLDMYSLLRFLRCSPFDEYKVWKQQVDNKSNKGTQRLNTLVKSLLLRRTKCQKTSEGKSLVSLPERSSETHELKLSEGEMKIYQRVYQQSRSTLQDYLKRHEDKEYEKEMKTAGSSKGNPWSKDDTRSLSTNQRNDFIPASQVAMGASSGTNQKQPGGGQILLLLLRLRQCCSHLNLMKNALDAEELTKDEGLDLDLAEQMQEMALKQDADVKEPSVNVSQLFETQSVSTKIKAVMDGIRQIREDSDKKHPMKSVVVSQWTKMLEIVEFHLKREGFRCVTIKGDVPPKKRAEMVDCFNLDPKGPEVMLVSLRAGGVGLNLIGGNHLFLIDMHWNPALEQQACDRIYRVGQKRNVFIHRFICKDTVEEKILELQKKKLSLAKNILTGAGASANKLTLADLRMLFDLDRPMPTPSYHGNISHHGYQTKPL